MKKMTYKTVLEYAREEMTERKSRFIASVKPVTTEEDAIAFINEIRAEFRTATHNVYAYKVSENNISRYSDDGEPSGTAGVPVLEVINKENLTDIAVVVTRFFGGTLLGAGGLVRAYGKSAKLGIDKAKITEKIYCYRLEITTPYDIFGKIKYIAENGDYIPGDVLYTEEVNYTVFVKFNLLDQFLKEIESATNASVIPKITGEMYVDKILEL